MKLLALPWSVALLPLFVLAQISSNRNAPLTRPDAIFVVWDLHSPLLEQLLSSEANTVRLALVGRVYRHSEMPAVAAHLRNTLSDLGYVTCSIDQLNVKPIERSVEARSVLSFRGSLGPRFRLRQIRWQNVTAIPLDMLTRLCPMAANDTFQPTKLRALYAVTRRVYSAAGYLNMSLTPDISFDTANGFASVTIVLDEGARVSDARFEEYLLQHAGK